MVHCRNRFLCALDQIHGGELFGRPGAKHQGAEGRRAGQVIADTVAGRVFTRYRPLLLRVHDRLIVAYARIRQVKPPVQEPFVEEP